MTSDLSGYATTSHNHDGVYATASHSHSTYATKTGSEQLTNKTITSFTGNNSATITTPSSTGTLALTSQIPTDYVTISGDQTIAGTKTFSSPPILNNNYIITPESKRLSFPAGGGTIVTQYTEQSLGHKTLEGTCNIDGVTLGTTSWLFKQIINAIYPVGSVYFGGNSSASSPHDRFSWQTWTPVSQGFYVTTVESLSNTSTNMPTSGTGVTGNITSNGTKLSVENLPSHNHTATSTFTGKAATGTFPTMHYDANNNKYDGTVFKSLAEYTKGFNGNSDSDSHTVEWVYTPQGSVSTTTNNTGGNTAHSHTITMPKLQLVCWIRTA